MRSDWKIYVANLTSGHKIVSCCIIIAGERLQTLSKARLRCSVPTSKPCVEFSDKVRFQVGDCLYRTPLLPTTSQMRLFYYLTLSLLNSVCRQHWLEHWPTNPLINDPRPLWGSKAASGIVRNHNGKQDASNSRTLHFAYRCLRNDSKQHYERDCSCLIHLFEATKPS